MSSQSFVAFVASRRRLILSAALLLAVVAGVRTVATYRNLKSDLEQLLPATAPAVAALDEARRRLPGLRHLGVVVDTGGRANADAGLQFLKDLERRVATYPPDVVVGVRSGVRQEREFLETHALQLLDPADVRALRESVEARHRWELARGTDMSLLSEEEDPAPEISLAAVEKKYVARHGRVPTFPGDRFLSDDGKTAVLVIQAGSQATGLAADQDLLHRVQRDVSSLGFPSAYARNLRLGFAGDIATRVEEARGLVIDLGVSGAVVLTLVLSSVAWFFRSIIAVPIVVLPVLLGTLVTFGLAALPPLGITSLNSNTAFLTSIIIGNGVNTGIILLARFWEQSARGQSREDALVVAVRETWRPTLGAAFAACVAYGSLLLAEFRGFRQFGWIGAIGMLACWGATYVLVPVFVRAAGGHLRVRPPSARATASQAIGKLVLARPRWILSGAALLMLGAVLGILRRQTDWLETDFSRLRRADSFVHGERYWGKRMDATLRTYLTPTVVLAPSAEGAQAVSASVRQLAKDGRAGGLIASVRTVEDVLPSTRDAAIDEARRLKESLTPTMLEALPHADRRRVERLLSEQALRPLTSADVPAALLAGLRDKVGNVDRHVLVFPKLGAATWDVRRMEEFTRDIRQAAKPAGEGTAVVGALLLSTDIVEALRKDGPVTTGTSIVLVLLVAVAAFRSWWFSVAAMVSLACGVLLMLGLGAWLGERFNFSNLIALPITFGIGADYSINVLKRFQRSGNLTEAVAGTGGAVALCSATTVIGFGSLVIAQNRALSSFGVLAIAGELACLATAVLVVPAYLAWRGAPNATAAPPMPNRQDQAL